MLQNKTYMFLFLQHPLKILSVLHCCNINQCQILGPVLQTGYKCSCRIQGSQDIYACLNGIAADDKTVMAALCSLSRDIHDQSI